jgi:hypothetical protein
MMTNLTTENALLLHLFLEESGLLKRLKRERAEAVLEDLCGLVGAIVAGAVHEATEELKIVAIQAGYDALDAQQSRFHENLRNQLAWPQ